MVLRLAADGSSVDGNVIMNAQIGIFLNGGNGYRITRNSISNIDIESGIHMQGHAPGGTGSLTNVLVERNTIFNLNVATRACGIHEAPDNNVTGNRILNNIVSDAYCGVEHGYADPVVGGRYINTLYEVLNVDLPEPPSAEP